MGQYKTDTIALRKLMAEQNINYIISLAEVTGVSRNVLGRILKGIEQPSSQTMYRLAEALHMSSEQAGKIFFSRNLLIT